MKIIRKVEINYFRSIYSVTLSDCKDLNLIVGGNDAGKSNTLRALNLFFNNQTELNHPYDFHTDLSRVREFEARETKGRAFLWIKVTFRNFLNWSSLPPTFELKRTWNRYSDTPEDTFFPRHLKASVVYRFLNKIRFHYTPAVRGREIFGFYLRELHDALASEEAGEFREASTTLVESINRSTAEMSSAIRENISLDSSIQFPEDFREFFNSLDFSTDHDGYRIPLRLRGDGVQSHHIPFILNFIAQRSKKHHVWAYEEPENSLEMSRAFELASQFQGDLSRENQIFVSSHSPAFYSVSGENVSKWFVRQENFGAQYQSTTIDNLDDSHLPDDELGIASLVADRAKQIFTQVKKLRQVNTALEVSLRNETLPTVFVEGPTDCAILATAHRKLFGSEPQFAIKPAHSASNLGTHLRSLADVRFDKFTVVGLLDSDDAGRKELHKVRHLKFFDETDFRVFPREHVYIGCFPLPSEYAEALETAKRALGSGITLPISSEFMLSPRAVRTAIEQGVIELQDRKVTAKDSEIGLEVNLSEKLQESLPDHLAHLARKIRDESKNGFSEWVGQLPASDFSYFSAVFELLYRITQLPHPQRED